MNQVLWIGRRGEEVLQSVVFGRSLLWNGIRYSEQKAIWGSMDTPSGVQGVATTIFSRCQCYRYSGVLSVSGRWHSRYSEILHIFGVVSDTLGTLKHLVFCVDGTPGTP